MVGAAPQGEVKRAGKSQTGALTNAFYAKQLELVKNQGEVFTLTVSTGENERVFYFTRGAILFAALGATGGPVLARKILARKLLTQARIDELDRLRDEKHPLLQDVIQKTSAIDAQVLAKLVEEVAEEQLLEVAGWESSLALYELVHGNVPGRLYSKETPAVRLSLGLNKLLERVLPRILETPERVLGPLGGSLKTKVRLGADRTPPEDATQQRILALFSDDWRPCLGVVAEAYAQGIPAHEAARAIATLVSARRLAADPAALSKEEELAQAEKIQASLDSFLNGLLARSHLARMYEHAGEKEKAVSELRSVAREHVLRDRIGDALSALKNALKLGPEDLPAREELIKVLVTAKRPDEASQEAVELSRQLLVRGLPGRARRALELSLRLVPGAEGVLWMLAGLVERLDDKAEAIRRYGQVAQVALEKGNEDGYLAANQKLLELDPENEAARRKVRIFSGYRRALIVRIATGVASILAGAFVLAYGTYQVMALKAFTDARDRIWAAIDEENFDGAKAVVLRVERDWSLSPRVRNACRDILGIIDLEASFAADRHCKRGLRIATRLEAEQKLPDAVRALKEALPFAGDNPGRRSPLDAALLRTQQSVADAQRALASAASLEGRLRHDRLAQALADFPWLKSAPELALPCEIATSPPRARITVDGKPLADTTPAVIDLPLAPTRIVVAAPNCENVVLARAVPLPSFQIALALPRRRVWTAAGVAGTVQPALGENLVVAVCDDRTVAGVARDTGGVLWRSPLGVFGDADAPPLVASGTVFVRTARGELVALDQASGKERWRRLLKAAPDATDSTAFRPVAIADGVVVRDGGQALVAVAADGAVKWRAVVRGNVVGAPAAASGFVFATSGRRLEVFSAANGSLVRASDLPTPATTGPVLGPEGAVFVGLEGGSVIRFDASGAATGPRTVAPSGIVALDASPTSLALVAASGEVLTLDARLRSLVKISLDQGSVPRWLRVVAQDFIIVGDGRGIVTFDAKGAEQWRDFTNAAPVVADDALIYQCGPAGLTAVER
ncbi:MAG TPA: PQQ-binding-like beta-propeller repeat protein [Planctomycetota bacterium]|nr:PQQ-binding-like beta-propeller repeat protein [Planctomycetota bacterium]